LDFEENDLLPLELKNIGHMRKN
jgi:hypothetical protein